MEQELKPRKWTGKLQPVPFEKILQVCQGARPMKQAPNTCHTELVINQKTGAARIRCAGACEKGRCRPFAVSLFGVLNLIVCACSVEDIGRRCDLVVVTTAAGQVLGAFCFGACAKGQTCFPGFVFQRGQIRLSCFCG